MTASSLIVLVVDRLGAGWLGPHGATWIDTPSFNRLAAASLLCENALADSPSLEQAYRGYLLGQHALASAAGREAWHKLQARLESTGDSLLAAEPPLTAPPSLPWLKVAEANATRTILLTDDPDVARYDVCQAFAEHIVLPVSDPSEPADDVDATSLAHLFEAAADTLRSLSSPFVLFIHARGMAGPWDAPLELRNRFADEDDPTPPTFVTPPNLRATPQFDPDELLGYRQAYAGQITLLDMCLGMLLDEIDRQPWAQQTALMVTSPRGYPLGHHGRIGPCDEALYGDLLHVPLLLRLPDKSTLAQRRRGIVQTSDIAATITDLLTPANSTSAPARSLLRLLREHQPAEWQIGCALGPDQRLIRTPAWLMRESLLGDHLHHELFVKPDDYWEVNEIASRGGDIVQLLAAELDRRHREFLAGGSAQSAPLPEPLTSVWR